MTELALPLPALLSIERLEKHGYEAYAVGGCVRDLILGRKASDCDIATSALPDEVARCFNDCRVVETGIKYGTVTVLFPCGSAEITSFRGDGQYNDGRHPSGVFFSKSLAEDLSRRDFTVNALAYNKKSGIVDLFGGVSHLNEKKIVCVGNPEKRFSEDALRIIRAVRFSSVLGFSVEENTDRAIRRLKDRLLLVSAERLHKELCLTLCGRYATEALLTYPDVLAVFIPEILPCIGFEQHSRFHKYDVWSHIAHAVGSAENNELVRVAALLHDIGKPECFSMSPDGTGHFKGHAAVSAKISGDILARLRFDKASSASIVAIIKKHSDWSQMNSEAALKRCLSALGAKNFFLLLSLCAADNSAKRDFCRERLTTIDLQREYAEKLLANGDCIRVSELAVDGNDMLALGLRGQKIGQTLEALLSSVLEGTAENSRETLLRLARGLNPEAEELCPR